MARFVDGPLKVLLLEAITAKSELSKLNCSLEKPNVDEESIIK